MIGEKGPAPHVYQGVWRILADLFRVPRTPPTLAATGSGEVKSFRPSSSFLDYLRFHFWFFLLLVDGLLFVAWLVLLFEEPGMAILLSPLALVAIVVPDVVAWVAIRLRYDTTWYVISDRSLRIRRGIWIIRETTVTFENVQNVELEQGPLQRWFGISNLTVQTAGGGGKSSPEKGTTNPHLALVEGIDDAQRIRDVIMTRVRASRRAGLGDEHPEERSVRGQGPQWSAEHLAALRGIRDAVAGLRQ
jgi:membrane protein YdbS with pleckstrin-like domain